MKEAYGHDSDLNLINEGVNEIISDEENENKSDEEYDIVQKNSKDLDHQSKYTITEIPFDFSAYVMNFSKSHVLYW